MCLFVQMSQKRWAATAALSNHLPQSGAMYQHGYITDQASDIYGIFWIHNMRDALSSRLSTF